MQVAESISIPIRSAAVLPLAIVFFLSQLSCRSIPSYSADGRMALDQLLRRYSSLSAARGWTQDTVYAYVGDPARILAWRTKRSGRALWILAGIHGEEPAGPNAIARSLEPLSALADSGVPVVLIPMCNPKAYRNNWRYPNTAERDWRKGGGYSVGDAEYLLADLDSGTSPRAQNPAGPETEALTGYALRLSKSYPPALVLDLHEDELSAEGGYIYSQGTRPKDNPVGAEIVRLLRSSGIPLRLSGKTRFGEAIDNGVISQDEKGLPIRDGSIDELFAAAQLFKDGKKVAGPAAPTVIVVETPAFSGSDLAKRVQAHGAVLARIRELWTLNEP